MNPLESLAPEELVKLSDKDFQDTVRLRARALSAMALDTYEDVAIFSDDDQARVNAADRIMKFAEAQDEVKALPFGVSEEVFKIALAGLGQIVSIARESRGESILRNVTPARADPRPFALLDNSPLNVPTVQPKENDSEEEIPSET